MVCTKQRLLATVLRVLEITHANGTRLLLVENHRREGNFWQVFDHAFLDPMRLWRPVEFSVGSTGQTGAKYDYEHKEAQNDECLWQDIAEEDRVEHKTSRGVRIVTVRRKLLEINRAVDYPGRVEQSLQTLHQERSLLNASSPSRVRQTRYSNYRFSNNHHIQEHFVVTCWVEFAASVDLRQSKHIYDDTCGHNSQLDQLASIFFVKRLNGAQIWENWLMETVSHLLAIVISRRILLVLGFVPARGDCCSFKHLISSIHQRFEIVLGRSFVLVQNRPIAPKFVLMKMRLNAGGRHARCIWLIWHKWRVETWLLNGLSWIVCEVLIQVVLKRMIDLGCVWCKVWRLVHII